MTHGETKAQKGEATSRDHTAQATEARGRLCRPGQMVEAGRGGLGPLRARGLPPPTLQPVSPEGQRLSLTDGILQGKSVLRVRGLCPPSVPTPDGRARPECSWGGVEPL